MSEKKFNEADLLKIFNKFFYQNNKIDISSELSTLYNSLSPESEKEKMLYMLKYRCSFNLNECKQLQKQLPIYYNKDLGQELDNFIWIEIPESMFQVDFISFIEKMENSNLPIAGIYIEHENSDEATHYTLDEAKKTCIAISSFYNEIDDKKNIYDIIENVLKKIAKDIDYNYQAADIDNKLLKNGYLSDDEEITILRQSQSLYGVLVKHKAICSGISKAVKQLLKKYVLDVSIIHNEKHSWNQIVINDKEIYNLDLTTAVVNKIPPKIIELLQNDESFYRNPVYDNISKKCIKRQSSTHTDIADCHII